jgi:flavin-dependent dehydrogenase
VTLESATGIGEACEVCVIGGGPAGAVAAWKLARLGHAVLVVERAAFPRPHVGEALSPGIWPQLDLLGLTGAVCAAGFHPTSTAMVRWSHVRAETVHHPDPPGLMVDRGRFDLLLLEHARRAGARLVQPGLALAPRRTAHGWIVPVRTPQGDRWVRASFLVDAGGRSSRLGNRRKRTGPPTLALHGTWVRTGGWGGETRVEAGPDEWLWAAPRPDGTLSAMAFVDVERYRSARMAGISREALYRSVLARSALLAEVLAAELVGSTGVCDATCWHDPEPVGDRLLKIGEAAFALDPLSSTGVQKAMQTAWSGAIAVHTLLTPDADGEAARRFYGENHGAAVERHAAWTEGFYATARRYAGHPFWRRRAAARHFSAGPETAATAAPVPSALDVGLRLSAAAALVATPCVTGDLIAARRALVHPGLDRPVAFLDGVEIAPLLDAVPSGATLNDLTALWSRQLPRSPAGQAAALADWLVRHGILVPG